MRRGCWILCRVCSTGTGSAGVVEPNSNADGRLDRATLSQSESTSATTEARVRFKDIGIQSDSINASIERALFYLDVADREFKEHRYAPFWDAMEAAATAIGECHASQGYLAFDIDQYVNALAGRVHNFPAWDLADPTHIHSVAQFLIGSDTSAPQGR